MSERESKSTEGQAQPQQGPGRKVSTVGVDNVAGFYFGAAFVNFVSAVFDLAGLEIVDGLLSALMAGMWATVGVLRTRNNLRRTGA